MANRDKEPATPRRLPPGQQLVAKGKWPIIGEGAPNSPNKRWKLTISDLSGEQFEFDVEQISQLPQTEITIDIHCVTRWSKYDMKFSGVLLSDLLSECGIEPQAPFVSFIANSARNHSTSLKLQEAIELGTLLAIEYDGAALPLDHGGPLRTIVPARYFYKSLKWLEKIELLEEDRLGYWESESGYHNGADPWAEQRYMAPAINKQEAARLIETRDMSGKDLRSIDASNRELDGLNAANASLRDANFSRSSLHGANFREANLSNAHFQLADLREADFHLADLEGADFSGADLRGTSLDAASLFGVSFFNPETQLEASFDAETLIPQSRLDDLTPQQADFVRQKK